MKGDQRRRLKAVGAALAPCAGCLDEDLRDVNTELGRLDPEHLERWRRVCDGVREQLGQPPHPPETSDEAEELEQQRAEVRERRNQLAELHTISAKTGASGQRKTCPGCLHRKRGRENLKRLAKRLGAALDRDPKEDIVDNPESD